MSVTKGAGCYWLPTDMYPVYICFVPDEASWRKLMRRLRIPADDRPYPTATAQVSTFQNDKTDDLCVAVTVHERNDKSAMSVLACLAHEASHVCDHVFEYICEKTPASEQRAYLMEFVVRHLAEAFDRSGRAKFA